MAIHVVEADGVGEARVDSAASAVEVLAVEVLAEAGKLIDYTIFLAESSIRNHYRN